MSRINLEDSEIRRPKIYGMITRDSASYPAVVTSQALAADTPGVVNITAASAANILLPPVKEGQQITVVNLGAGTITFQTSAGVALSPAVTAATGVTTVLMVVSGLWKKVN